MRAVWLRILAHHFDAPAHARAELAAHLETLAVAERDSYYAGLADSARTEHHNPRPRGASPRTVN